MASNQSLNTREEILDHYETPDKVVLSNNVPLSRLLPGRGRKGVVVPSAVGAYGERNPIHDVGANFVLQVDPGFASQEISVDFSLLTREEVAACEQEAAKSDGTGHDQGAYAYVLMAELCKAKRKNKSANLPAASKPAKTQKRTANQFIGSLLAEFSNGDTMEQATDPIDTKDEAHVMAQKVIFELPRPIGQIVCHYHDVVRTDSLLILIADHKNVQQFVWFPQPPDDDSGDEPAEIAALVFDKQGNPDTLFSVIATPARFVYNQQEFCVLVIHREKQYKSKEATDEKGIV